MTKDCTKCKENKDFDEFRKNSSKPDGVSAWCTSCIKKYTKRNPVPVHIKRAQNQRYWRKPESLMRRREKQKEDRRNPQVRLKMSIKTSVSSALRYKQKTCKTFAAIGYTINELKQHLESQFTEGMNWDNYGKWHIDHVIPQSFFEFESTNDVEFKMCWRLENLQPMWALDNIKKGNKLVA